MRGGGATYREIVEALGVSKNNPTTVRKNVGAGRHGCLAVYVRRGRELLLQVT